MASLCTGFLIGSKLVFLEMETGECMFLEVSDYVFAGTLIIVEVYNIQY